MRDLQHYKEQTEEVEDAIKSILPYFQCTLMTMPGIDIVTAANILSEIGNIERFSNANKLAKFAGIAPVNFSSAGKGRDMCPKQAFVGHILLSGDSDGTGRPQRNGETSGIPGIFPEETG